MEKYRTRKPYKDITNHWIGRGAGDGVVKEALSITIHGIKYNVDKKCVQLRYSEHEKNIAQLINKRTGKNVYVLPKINKPDGIKTPDYRIDSHLYELKTINILGRNTIYNAIKKKKQSSNYIIYISKDISTTNDLILKQINKVFNNFETRHVKRIVLIKNDEIQAVYKKTSHT